VDGLGSATLGMDWVEWSPALTTKKSPLSSALDNNDAGDDNDDGDDDDDDDDQCFDTCSEGRRTQARKSKPTTNMLGLRGCWVAGVNFRRQDHLKKILNKTEMMEPLLATEEATSKKSRLGVSDNLQTAAGTPCELTLW
jgi:hypothetical protein